MELIPQILLIVLSYVLLVPIGNSLILNVLESLRKPTADLSDLEKSILRWIGGSERVLYVVSFLLGQPEFVVFWLTLKTAAAWKGADLKDRATYNVFLTGNALSILWALIVTWGIGYLAMTILDLDPLFSFKLLGD